MQKNFNAIIIQENRVMTNNIYIHYLYIYMHYVYVLFIYNLKQSYSIIIARKKININIILILILIILILYNIYNKILHSLKIEVNGIVDTVNLINFLIG